MTIMPKSYIYYNNEDPISVEIQEELYPAAEQFNDAITAAAEDLVQSVMSTRIVQQRQYNKFIDKLMGAAAIFYNEHVRIAAEHGIDLSDDYIDKRKQETIEAIMHSTDKMLKRILKLLAEQDPQEESNNVPGE